MFEPSVVTLPDGRDLQFWDQGGDGLALVFHHGTPASGWPDRDLISVAAGFGLRLVTYSRAGYAGSSRRAGRAVADVAGDIGALLDHLGIDRFLTAGASGGGPHALACGAGLASRCAAVGVIAGVAPLWSGSEPDWTAGMGPENIEEFAAARAGEQALGAYLTAASAFLANVTGEELGQALGGLVPQVDLDALRGTSADDLAAAARLGLAPGYDGWLDDDLAFVRNWGFELGDVSVPVSLWQGDEDLMVPAAHGAWQAERIADVRAHLLPGHGHLSIAISSLPDILTDLIEISGLR